jgi:integrase
MSVRKRATKTGAVWLVDYRDGSGTRRARQFPTKGVAVTFAAKTKTELVAGVHTPDSASVTVKEAADLWLARARREGLEAATILNYQGFVTLHLLPVLGSVRLSRLTVATITAARNKLLDSGRSTGVVQAALTSLSGIIANAQRAGLASFNSVPLVERVRHDRRGSNRPTMPSREELQAILAAAKQPRARVLVLLAVFGGLRASEIRGLTWPNVDLKTGVIHVRQRADRYGQLGPPKSQAGVRDIPIGTKLLSVLRTWRLACPSGPLDLVLPAADGGIETYNHLLRRVFWPLLAAAGVVSADGAPKFGLHSLRHACASLWIAAGFSPKELQVWMGHASVKMTFDRYGHLFASDQDNAREAFDRLAVRLVD